jgi:hypothetical protein
MTALAEGLRRRALAGIDAFYAHVEATHGADAPNWPPLNGSDRFGVACSEALGLQPSETGLRASARGTSKRIAMTTTITLELPESLVQPQAVLRGRCTVQSKK